MSERKEPYDYGDGPEFSGESSVYCPYCGAEYETCELPTDWGPTDSIELECGSCGHTFKADYTIDYNTQRMGAES